MSPARRLLLRSVVTIMIAVIALVQAPKTARAAMLGGCGETTLCWHDCSMGPTMCNSQGGEGCAAVICMYFGGCSNYGPYVTIGCGAVE